jgi:hypothetical protein
MNGPWFSNIIKTIIDNSINLDLLDLSFPKKLMTENKAIAHSMFDFYSTDLGKAKIKKINLSKLNFTKICFEAFIKLFGLGRLSSDDISFYESFIYPS